MQIDATAKKLNAEFNERNERKAEEKKLDSDQQSIVYADAQKRLLACKKKCENKSPGLQYFTLEGPEPWKEKQFNP